MQSFRLALALLRLPRLFLSLFVFPCLVGLLLIFVQLLATRGILGVFGRTPQQIKNSVTQVKKINLLNKLLHDVDGELPPIMVCRWGSLNGRDVISDTPGCKIEPYDLVINTLNVQSLAIERYIELANGRFKRIHICEDCSSGFIVNLRDGPPETHVSSVWLLGVLAYIRASPKAVEQIVEAMDRRSLMAELFGVRYLHVPGLINPVRLDDLADMIGVIANLAVLIVISLWLALRAHRRVLDYFVTSGALLPLVAAVGKRTFYAATWVLTFIRVAGFLSAAIPLGYIVLVKSVSSLSLRQLFFSGDVLNFILWLFALLASFTLASFVSSIADLKHRHSFFSAIYRYVPLVLCLIGGGLWAMSFLVASDASRLMRDLLASLPLLGMVSVLLAPIFQPAHGVLVASTLLTVAIAVFVGKANARWFAAHLDGV